MHSVAKDLPWRGSRANSGDELSRRSFSTKYLKSGFPRRYDTNDHTVRVIVPFSNCFEG